MLKKQKTAITQFNRRLPLECVQDFQLAVAVNKSKGHSDTNVIIDLMNYYTDFGLPQEPNDTDK